MSLKEDLSVWKWIAGILVAMAVSGVSSAMVFRTTPGKIKSVIQESFTDISDSRGMYAKEGRPRLHAIEVQAQAQMEVLRDIRDRLSRIEVQLEKK